MNVLSLKIPIQIKSEGNGRDFWRVKAERVAQQRQTTAAHLLNAGVKRLRGKAYVVTLRNIAPWTLDDDNLVSGFKGIRDEVAKRLGVDDGDRARIKFHYDQGPGEVGEKAISITIAVAA